MKRRDDFQTTEFSSRLSQSSDPMTLTEMRETLYLCNFDSVNGEDMCLGLSARSVIPS